MFSLLSVGMKKLDGVITKKCPARPGLGAWELQITRFITYNRSGTNQEEEEENVSAIKVWREAYNETPS